jgi:DnaJ-class molecular chaperone
MKGSVRQLAWPRHSENYAHLITKMMKDPYSTLGVSKTATQDEIKSAYRSLAKKFHPDLNPGNKEREARFKDISAAYEKIGDAESRAKFDRGETEEFAHAGAGGGFGGQGNPFYSYTQGGDGARYTQGFGGGMDSDFFENLFRQAGAGGRGRAQSADYPGEDALYQMELSFRDAALGAEQDLTLPGGKKLHVVIPAGIESGQRLRFRGQGAPGVGNGPAGDAYVEVQVRPQPGFARKGQDIETEVPISLFEAVNGGEIQVPTIDGAVSLKVPPRVSSGAKLRVRGKGIASKAGRGDQIVSLKIVQPKSPNPEWIEAMKALGEKFAYNPRSEA